MKVIDYIEQADPHEVARLYEEAYTKDGWAKPEVFVEFVSICLSMTPTEPDMVVTISFHEDGEDSYYGVSGVEEGTSYAIEYSDWEEWLNCEVLYPAELSLNQIAMHIYYEMTWAGWPEDIRKRRDEIFAAVESVKNDPNFSS